MPIQRRQMMIGMTGLSLLASGNAWPKMAAIRRDKEGDAERIQAVFQQWDAVSDHRTGTIGDRITAEWLAREIRAAGVDPTLADFPFTRRTVQHAYAIVDGRRIEGVPLFDGGESNSPVQAPLRPLDRGFDIGVGLFSPHLGSPHSQALMDARRSGQHAGMIAISSGDEVRPGLAVINADNYRNPFGPPVLQVATEHRSWLLNAAAKEVEGTLQIRFGREETRAVNVGASFSGRSPELSPVVVMTPRSGWWSSTSERGGGIAAWLESIRHFARAEPLRPVIFTANTGHELGHLGLEAFLGDNPGLVRGAHVWVHLGANFAARGGRIRLQASSEPIRDSALNFLASYNIKPDAITPVGTRPGGEARDVFDGGGQYVSLLGGRGGNPLFHHPDDRWPDSVDMAKALGTTRAIVSIVDQLANEPE